MALVGQPNVGKSVIMNLLTGAGAVVSNYPGTTVEVTQGEWALPGQDTGAAGTRERHTPCAAKKDSLTIKVIDTPGVYSLHSDTEEQKVTQRVLLERNVDLIVNVVDARALDRSLYLTLQLCDLEIPMVVALNQMDLAGEAGFYVDSKKLSGVLGVPVVPMVACKGTGLEDLKEVVRKVVWKCVREGVLDDGNGSGACAAAAGHFSSEPVAMVFSDPVEQVIELLAERITASIPGEWGRHRRHPARALAIHLLEHDSLDEDLFVIYPWLHRTVEAFQKDMASGSAECSACFRGCSICPKSEGHPAFLTCLERSARARRIAGEVTRRTSPGAPGLRARLEAVLDPPWPGIPLQLCIMAFAFVVIKYFMDYAEEGISWLVGGLTGWLLGTIEGVFPGGAAYAILTAIIDSALLPFSVVMPAMLSIYVVMAILEDSGLLPRISVSLDRLMSMFGLPGHSTIPIVLGFGCKAPAVLATRVLGDRRSRLVVSTLIAITVPCAASLGIITGVTDHFGASLPAVYGSMAAVFVLLGLTMGRVSSGGEPLVLEIPPLRLPVLSNVWDKVKMRLDGFFRQVLPLLVITGVLVRMLVDAEALSWVSVLDPVTRRFFGISGQSMTAVLVSVVQRYMAPMVLLNLPLSAREATIAAAMVSVSMPCLPVSVLIWRELGGKSLAKVFGTAVALSAAVGMVLNLLLPYF